MYSCECGDMYGCVYGGREREMYRLAARVLLYVSSQRQDNTYHGLCYSNRGALAGTRNVCGERERCMDVFVEREMYIWRERCKGVCVERERDRYGERDL